MIELELLSTKIFLVNSALIIEQKIYLNFNFVLKTNPWTYKIKDLNGETIIGSFCENELLLSKLLMSCYLEPENHIRDKVKVKLDFPNWATKKN